MVGEDRDRVRSSLQVLFPFHKSEDDGEKLPVIYVIVVFRCRESLGKVSAGVEVPRFIRLHQDGTSGKEGSVGHEGEGTSDVGDT